MSEQQGIYQHHRDNQVERILEAAELLFVRDCIESVTMSAIADEARIARKTLYRYFQDRDAIALAIYQKLLDELVLSFPSLTEGTGYARLEKLTVWFRSQLQTHRDNQRFLVEFHTLYARQYGGEYLLYNKTPSGAGFMNEVIQIIRDGAQDGSLQPDLNAEEVAAAFLNLLIGMNARFALMGDVITQEYDQQEQDIYQEICRIFMRGIQSISY